MSNLEDIIKQKVEQFDVPFNEAHWEAMDAKLHAIKIAKIKRNLFLTAAIVVAISAISILFFQTETINNEKTSSQSELSQTNTNNHLQNKNSNLPSNKEVKTIVTNTEDNKPKDIENVNNEISIANNESEIEEKTTDYSSSEIIVHDNQVTSPDISAEFIVYNNHICLGEEVSFEVIEKGNVSYLWEFGDGNSSTQANPKHNYLSNGTYSVKLTVTDKSTGKNVSNKVREAVNILPLPNADFTIKEQADKHDANKLKYPYTEFTSKDNSLESYTWNFGNGQTATSSNPKIIYDKKGTFKATLIVRNAFGCINSTSKNALIDSPSNLFAPNAFSPNNDGDNDVFIPKALLTWDVQFEMLITDKAGSVIFKSNDKYNGWNGKQNNKEIDLNAGIYFWQVVTYDAEGIPHQHYGKVNLIR